MQMQPQPPFVDEEYWSQLRRRQLLHGGNPQGLPGPAGTGGVHTEAPFPGGVPGAGAGGPHGVPLRHGHCQFVPEGNWQEDPRRQGEAILALIGGRQQQGPVQGEQGHRVGHGLHLETAGEARQVPLHGHPLGSVPHHVPDWNMVQADHGPPQPGQPRLGQGDGGPAGKGQAAQEEDLRESLQRNRQARHERVSREGREERKRLEERLRRLENIQQDLLSEVRGLRRNLGHDKYRERKRTNNHEVRATHKTSAVFDQTSSKLASERKKQRDERRIRELKERKRRSGNNTETKSLDGTNEKTETSAENALPLPEQPNQDNALRTPDPEEGGQDQLRPPDSAVNDEDEELLRGAVNEAEQILNSLPSPSTEDSDMAHLISDYDHLLGDGQ